MGYLYIMGTIVFTVYGQIILKWRIGIYGSLPDSSFNKITFLLKLVYDPIILSGLIAAFVASLFWMATMTKFEISYAYPFMSISYVFVFILSIPLFQESFSFYKLFGLLLIICGIVVSSKSI